MKKQLFIFSFAVAMVTNVIAFNELTMFDETNEASKWTFIENKFITQPAAEKQFIWTHVGAAVTGLVIVGTFGTHLATSSKDLNEQPKLDKMLTMGNILTGFGSAATAIGATSALDCYLSARANRNAVANFFNNYENNQFFVPEELQNAFDLIAEAIEFAGMDAVLVNADDIVGLIQFQVMRKFEKRYEKVLQATAVNALADAKTVTEIVKNSIESVSKLGGSAKKE